MSEQDSVPLRHFFVGAVLLMAIQTCFMLGGYLVEKNMGYPVTGIPSSVGLTLVLIVDLLATRRMSQYVMLGSFTFAFLSPLLLFMVTYFKVVPFASPVTWYSLAYLVALTGGVWAYFMTKIIRGNM